jgi:hypothetical protein
MTTHEFETARRQVDSAIRIAHDCISRAFDGLEGVTVTSPETAYIELQLQEAREHMEKAQGVVGTLEEVSIPQRPELQASFSD